MRGINVSDQAQRRRNFIAEEIAAVYFGYSYTGAIGTYTVRRSNTIEDALIVFKTLDPLTIHASGSRKEIIDWLLKASSETVDLQVAPPIVEHDCGPRGTFGYAGGEFGIETLDLRLV